MDESEVRRSQMLDVLDHEITRLNADAQWAGLTVWALLGALAGVGWLVSEELSSSPASFQLLKIAFLWLVCSIFVDSLLGFGRGLEGGSVIGQEWHSPRLFAASRYLQLVRGRRVTVFVICRSAVLIYVLTHVDGAVLGSVLRALLLVTYSLSILISGFALAVSATALPVVIQNLELSKPWVSLKIGITLALALVCAAIAWKSRLMIWGATWTELRVGILLWVATWLFEEVLERSSSKGNLDRLHDARRDLGLGVLGPDEARKILERTLTGEDVARAVDEVAAPELALMERMIDHERTMEREAIRLRDEVSAVDGPLGPDLVARVRSFVELSVTSAKGKKPELDELRDKTKAARRGLKRLLLTGPAKDLSAEKQLECDERLRALVAAGESASEAFTDLIRLANSRGYSK